MQFTTTLTSLFFVFAVALMSVVQAVPLLQRDVYVPPITYPHEGTVWKVGDHHNVTWDNTNPPKQITNPVGRILLRKGDLTTSTVLASNFSILLGRIEVEVPEVTPGDYTLVLFGDSGNFSPVFKITN
ncbi:hypothetical protein BC834DRAFT_816913 [Gloeopeniophorella convolvens]|nr:hypothetical protein BC834DRAFT_816913 [Gloeopeniophorella convolvens]